MRRVTSAAPNGAEEGTYYPFDQSPLSGCGERRDGGDRVAWILFDVSDFSPEVGVECSSKVARVFDLITHSRAERVCAPDASFAHPRVPSLSLGLSRPALSGAPPPKAIGHALLRVTPDHFPARAAVHVHGPCIAGDAFAPDAGDDGDQDAWRYTTRDGIETSITWLTMPDVVVPGAPLCTWRGDDETLYWEASALTCDVTNATVAATRSGHRSVCFRLTAALDDDLAAGDGYSRAWRREPVSFFSSEVDEAPTRSVTPAERALAHGTVADDQRTVRPNLLITPTRCGRFPDQVQADATGGCVVSDRSPANDDDHDLVETPDR